MLHIGYKHIRVDAPHEYHQSNFHRINSQSSGWVPAVGELYYRLNPISFDDSRTTLLEGPLIKLLAQRPITLVLMMINSCSYITNDLVLN